MTFVPVSSKTFSVHVIDLTSRLGIYALEQLGIKAAGDSGFWPDIKSPQLPDTYGINWQRAKLGDVLQQPVAQTLAVVLIAGPGSMVQLKSVLGLLEQRQDITAWTLVAPNAIVEESFLRSYQTSSKSPLQVYRLPTSDPQTLWFVLMEQFGKVFETALINNPDLQPQPGESIVASNLKQSIEQALTIDGALAAALVDYRSGMCLAQAGSGLNLDLAAAGNTQVVRAKLQTIESLGLRRGIEDILITLADQYHLIRLVPNSLGLFLYLVLDKAKGNLALARYKLTEIERTLKV